MALPVFPEAVADIPEPVGRRTEVEGRTVGLDWGRTWGVEGRTVGLDWGRTWGVEGRTVGLDWGRTCEVAGRMDVPRPGVWAWRPALMKSPPTTRQLSGAIQNSWSLINLDAPISIRPREPEALHGGRYPPRTRMRSSVRVSSWSRPWIRIQNTTYGLARAPARDTHETAKESPKTRSRIDDASTRRLFRQNQTIYGDFKRRQKATPTAIPIPSATRSPVESARPGIHR